MYETLADIESLLGHADETANLEFKSGLLFGSLGNENARRELVKDVTAFANAGGGWIIFGIAERAEGNRTIADRLEPVPDGAMARERLTQILAAQTDPRLIDFKITIIPCDGGSIFVLAIDEGYTAFQNRLDQKYYQRVDATVQTMYGYAIRDVMNRRTGALVRASFKLTHEVLQKDVHRYKIVPHLANVGAISANHWILEIDLPVSPIGLNQQAPVLILDQGEVRFEHMHLRRVEFSSERNAPTIDLRLLPGFALSLDMRLGFVALQFVVDAVVYRQILPFSRPIRWNLYVDNSPKQTGVIPFDEWCRF